MSLEVVICDQGRGYYLSDGTNECEEFVGWGEVIEFDGAKYAADLDDGDDVHLYELTELQEGSAFEVITEEEGEGDDDDEEDDTLPVESVSG